MRTIGQISTFVYNYFYENILPYFPCCENIISIFDTPEGDTYENLDNPDLPTDDNHSTDVDFNQFQPYNQEQLNNTHPIQNNYTNLTEMLPTTLRQNIFNQSISNAEYTQPLLDKNES